MRIEMFENLSSHEEQHSSRPHVPTPVMIGPLLAREEEHKARSVELPVGAQYLHPELAGADHLGRGSRGVLLHPLVLVHREQIRAGRFADHVPEWRVDHHERRVRRQDRDARGILSELRPHDHEVVQIDVVHPAGLEEVHAPGLHEPRADDRAWRDHAAPPANVAA
jgi:hypothetical protein